MAHSHRPHKLGPSPADRLGGSSRVLYKQAWARESTLYAYSQGASAKPEELGFYELIFLKDIQILTGKKSPTQSLCLFRYRLVSFNHKLNSRSWRC
jgi:hypothetical protein